MLKLCFLKGQMMSDFERVQRLEPKVAHDLTRHCLKVWDPESNGKLLVDGKLVKRASPFPYANLRLAVGRLFELANDVEDQRPDNIQRISDIRHTMTGLVAAVEGFVTMGAVQEGYDRVKRCCDPKEASIAFLIEQGIAQDIQEAAEEMLAWLKKNYSEETFPAELQGMGLGLTVNAASAVPPVPPTADLEP